MEVFSMVKEGEQAIDFTLAASNGEKVSLSDYKGKNVVLYFYPKDETPGCTTEACDFRDHFRELTDLNTVILGVSRDSISSHEKFSDHHQLPFLLLSDSDAEVCKQYGILQEKTSFGKKAIGMERSTFIIDANGKVRKVYRQVKVKDHVDKVRQFIEKHLV
jgi:thioredoxin-dependent peroxiredoxin